MKSLKLDDCLDQHAAAPSNIKVSRLPKLAMITSLTPETDAHRIPVGAPGIPQANHLKPSPRLQLPSAFANAVGSKCKVSACPHSLYKYPARFSPEFAREAIRAFSQPGDLVLDVFNGGGTTIVEAIALGRRSVGYDISQLACFIARTKTTPLTIHDERHLLQWGATIHLSNHPIDRATWDGVDTDDGYYRRNLPDGALQFFAGIILELDNLPKVRQRRFARLVLLSVGQWALDCKKKTPSSDEMLSEFRRKLSESVIEFRSYHKRVTAELGLAPGQLANRRTVIRASSELCGQNHQPAKNSVSLIVTSPPYPGVHMLYHRWQILGRRETPAPFIIADCRDGDGISFYSLGHRAEAGLKTYYKRLTKVFSAARPTLKANALVIQMVAFNEPTWQLPAFLEAMAAAGYDQILPEQPCGLATDGNMWRVVPGRKWYVAATKKGNAAGKEVVLFHRPRPETD